MNTDARRARNVATVEAFYESERRRDLDTWRTFWRRDGRQTFPFAPGGTVQGLEELVRITARKFEVRPPYAIRTVVEPFDDPERVLARLGIVPDGHDEVGTHIWCIFHFDEAAGVRQSPVMCCRSSPTRRTDLT